MLTGCVVSSEIWLRMALDPMATTLVDVVALQKLGGFEINGASLGTSLYITAPCRPARNPRHASPPSKKLPRDVNINTRNNDQIISTSTSSRGKSHRDRGQTCWT